MNHDLSNAYVSLQKDKDVYVIRHEGAVTGQIHMDNGMVDICIQPEYQGRHYAANALYLFTAYAHDNLMMNEIRAVVPVGESIIKHVVEHCGYHSQLPGNELPGLKRMIQGSFASTYPDTAIPTVTMLLYFSAS